MSQSKDEILKRGERDEEKEKKAFKLYLETLSGKLHTRVTKLAEAKVVAEVAAKNAEAAKPAAPGKKFN